VVEDVHRHREDDGRVVLGRDTAQRLQVAELKRTGTDVMIYETVSPKNSPKNSQIKTPKNSPKICQKTAKNSQKNSPRIRRKICRKIRRKFAEKFAENVSFFVQNTASLFKTFFSFKIFL
jgi:hypothetical protein